MIETENLNEARKQIDKQYKEKKKIIIKGRDILFNRLILENKKVNILILSHQDKKDNLKQRDSGLNQVLCKIAKQNNISLGIDLNELKIQNKKQKAEVLSRIIQNIKLIKKSKNKLKIFNSKKTPEEKAVFLTLGLPTEMIKEL